MSNSTISNKDFDKIYFAIVHEDKKYMDDTEKARLMDVFKAFWIAHK